MSNLLGQGLSWGIQWMSNLLEATGGSEKPGDEQSPGSTEEKPAGATGGSEKLGDEQSPGSTKKKSVKEEFEGLPEDTLKQMLIDEIGKQSQNM